MNRLLTHFGLAAVMLLAAYSAGIGGDVPVLPDIPYNYANIELPAHLNDVEVIEVDNTPENNLVTDSGATLGRVLFYDKRLSANRTISCSSCHIAENGFSDPAQFSIGFDGGETARNSMGLSFTRFYATGRYFWDERAATLEDQTLMPIQDPVEMGMELPDVVNRLEATSFYPDLFAEAFETPEITPDRMAMAMAQFIRSMVAPDSRYDQGRVAQGGPPGTPLPNLTVQENEGLQIFFGEGKCSMCHESDLFISGFPRSNGLDSSIVDPGVVRGTFKVNSLRNIELTAPYMHDGRFETLEEVVEFYNSGVQPTPYLDRLLTDADGEPIRFNFTEEQRAALVAFLKTLTDRSIMDVRWSDPFNITTVPSETPGVASMDPAFPNPVGTHTTLSFQLTEPTTIELVVFDLLGRRIATLASGSRDAGAYEVSWDAGDVPSGIYLVLLEAAGQRQTQTLTVVR